LRRACLLNEAIVAPEHFVTDEKRWRSEHAALDGPIGVPTQTVLDLMALDIGHQLGCWDARLFQYFSQYRIVAKVLRFSPYRSVDRRLVEVGIERGRATL